MVARVDQAFERDCPAVRRASVAQSDARKARRARLTALPVARLNQCPASAFAMLKSYVFLSRCTRGICRVAVQAHDPEDPDPRIEPVR